MTLDIEILQYLHFHPLSSRVELTDGVRTTASAATVKRLLADAVKTYF